jgi:hypothetical protein
MSTTVFISSTSRDLREHRAVVAQALLNAGFRPNDMANFMARPEGATSVSLKEVAESDLFVGIYAWRYGFIPPGSNVSITEQEFLEAQRLGKPRFCFMVDDTYAWPDDDKKGGAGAQLLAEFKARLDAELVRSTFTTPDDLAMKVLASLQRWERERATTAPESAEASGSSPSSGGVNIGNVSGSVNLGAIVQGTNVGDLVGGDIVHGDKVGGNVVEGSTGVAIGPGASAQVSQGISGAELADLFAQIRRQIEARPEDPDVDKAELTETLDKVEQEVDQGDQANTNKLARWLGYLAEMAPDIFEVTVATLVNPAVGVATVIRKVAQKAQAEAG